MVPPTACRRPVSGTVSLPSSGCFSPFPHGTGSLSVSKEYLAFGGGPPIFRQDFTCPALLDMSHRSFLYGAVTLCCWPFQTIPVTSARSAGPRSLATTSGVSLDFLSSGYLDVSVPRVCSYSPMYSGISTCLTPLCAAPELLRNANITECQVGSPIRTSMDQSLFPAPHGLTQGITSFIASYCQGIHQTPFSRLI